MSESRYQLDGTRCRVPVIRASHHDPVACDFPGREHKCEFHHLLQREAELRRRCRSGGSGSVRAKAVDSYGELMTKLTLALRRSRVASSTGVLAGRPR